MLALVAMLLAVEPGCDAGRDCQSGGFLSLAALHFGSGTPDFVCGNADYTADGGWGSGSKYCYFESLETGSYDQGHPDWTFGSKWPRSAGLLFGLHNPFFGSGALVFDVDFAGNVFSYGSYFAYGNGGGLRNGGSYAAMYGTGSGSMPDTVVGPMVNHYNTRPIWGAWTGWEWPLAVQGDGFVRVTEVPLKVVQKDEGLQFVVQLPDGGVRTALAGWQ